MQYTFCKFILCCTWEFCVVLYVRRWPRCEPGAMGKELWPRLNVSFLLIYLDLGWLHVGLATYVCTKLQCEWVCRVSESSQPPFASLPTLEVGQMQLLVLGNTWAALHLNWSVYTPDALIHSLGKLFTGDEELSYYNRLFKYSHCSHLLTKSILCKWCIVSEPEWRRHSWNYMKPQVSLNLFKWPGQEECLSLKTWKNYFMVPVWIKIPYGRNILL